MQATKMMQVSFLCTQCGGTSTESWQRQPVENLLPRLCLTCRSTLTVERVVNWTKQYQSRAIAIANFSDPAAR